MATSMFWFRPHSFAILLLRKLKGEAHLYVHYNLFVHACASQAKHREEFLPVSLILFFTRWNYGLFLLLQFRNTLYFTFLTEWSIDIFHAPKLPVYHKKNSPTFINIANVSKLRINLILYDSVVFVSIEMHCKWLKIPLTPIVTFSHLMLY